MSKRVYAASIPHPDDGEVIERLELEGDGRFVYTWEWCTYAWRIIHEVRGTWTETESGVALHVETSEMPNVPSDALLAAQRSSDGYELRGSLLVGSHGAPPNDDDPSQEHEMELELELFERSLHVAPSKLVK